MVELAAGAPADRDGAADWPGSRTSTAPGRPVDPLLRRIAVLTVAAALVVPVASALDVGGGSEAMLRTAGVASPLASSGTVAQSLDPTTAPAITPDRSPATLPPTTLPDSAGAAAAAQGADAGGVATADDRVTAPSVSASAPARTAAPRTEPPIAALAPPATPATTATTALAPPSTPPATAPPTPAPTEAPATTPATQAPATAAPAAAPATSDPLAAHRAAVAACGNRYEVRPGESWFLLANRAGLRVATLLQVNAATVDTPLYAGRDICLPAGVTMPAGAPATSAPATSPATSAPAPTPTPATAPPSSAAPAPPPATQPTPTAPATTTTAPAPTTTAEPLPAPPANTWSRAQVDAIIRATWPDELEEEAVRIATRESNLIPTVRNWCCVGLFQIYWSVHKSWLAGLGVTSANQLYDPQVNANAAYALYQRSGGWGPWE